MVHCWDLEDRVLGFSVSEKLWINGRLTGRLTVSGLLVFLMSSGQTPDVETHTQLRNTKVKGVELEG